jgi:hypothetical protein
VSGANEYKLKRFKDKFNEEKLLKIDEIPQKCKN